MKFYLFLIGRLSMKVKVSMYSGGITFDEIVIVERFEDASKVALQRNPFARVINRKVIPMNNKLL